MVQCCDGEIDDATTRAAREKMRRAGTVYSQLTTMADCDQTYQLSIFGHLVVFICLSWPNHTIEYAIWQLDYQDIRVSSDIEIGKRHNQY